MYREENYSPYGENGQAYILNFISRREIYISSAEMYISAAKMYISAGEMKFMTKEKQLYPIPFTAYQRESFRLFPNL